MANHARKVELDGGGEIEMGFQEEGRPYIWMTDKHDDYGTCTSGVTASKVEDIAKALIAFAAEIRAK